MRLKRLAIPALPAIILAAIPGRTETPAFTEYLGMCDASAAIQVGPEMFLVANDEDNRLRLYRHGVAKAMHEFDIGEFLKAGHNEEADLEGATRAPNDVVYWISSHGANRNGKPRPVRRRLFATRIALAGTSAAVETLHRPYSGLVEDLAREPKLEKFGFATAATLAPETTGGLNIEGLASTPEGRLLIGFRNPILGGRALIIPLNNPDAVLDGSGKPRFGDAIELDLGGSGVRSLEYVNAKGAYLIAAGPAGDDGAFKLFLWDGPGTSIVTEIREALLQDLQPEAFVIRPGSKEILLISDDGGRQMGERKCKDAPPSQQRFRTKPFTLP